MSEPATRPEAEAVADGGRAISARLNRAWLRGFVTLRWAPLDQGIACIDGRKFCPWLAAHHIQAFYDEYSAQYGGDPSSYVAVIGYDTLWELTHVDDESVPIELWLTMGSPLGQRYLKRRLLGCDRSGAGRYPGGIRRWVNLTAVGDMTAIDPVLADVLTP